MKSIRVTLWSKKALAMELSEGKELPKEAWTFLRTYIIEMPDDDYETLKSEAQKENIPLEKYIFKKYRYANQLPKTWKVT